MAENEDVVEAPALVRTAVLKLIKGKQRVIQFILEAEGTEIEGFTLVPTETGQLWQIWDGETFSDPPADVRFVVVKGGVVTREFMAEPDFTTEDEDIVRSDDAQIGQWYDGENFFDPPPAERYAQIKDGVVVNVIMAREGLELPGYELVRSDTAQIGQLYADGVFSDPIVPLDDQKAVKRAAVSSLLNAKLTAGYPHDFGAPHGIKLLQTRDIEDRTNWLTSQAAYSAAVASGAGAVMGANFRTADNVNITLSYSAGLGVVLAMAAWGAAHYGRSWGLKDAIEAAEDEAALAGIDIEAGWPS